MKTIILGLGNPILSDDGIGLRVAGALKKHIDQPDIDVVEGSVAGLDLLDLLSKYNKAIIIDAIQTSGRKAGQVYRLEPGEFTATLYPGTLHDINLATALEIGRRLGIALPEKIVIFAIEVTDVITFSERCAPEVEQVIPIITEMVIQELKGEG